ncbi:MAG TPA: flagellar hook-basal body complex protein FliE [Tissierellaceae bacterium]|nr:flagellar hook-basal body complex protein FliE [Tissierellaceae bacterium]
MNILSLYNNNFLKTNQAIKNQTSQLGPVNRQAKEEGETSFKDLVGRELERLNNQQIKADEMIKDFISGQADDLHTVLIATEEARLTLELAVQIRNKCIEAYREINNMQL